MGRAWAEHGSGHPTPSRAEGLGTADPGQVPSPVGHKGHQAPVVPRDQVGSAEDGQEAA